MEEIFACLTALSAMLFGNERVNGDGISRSNTDVAHRPHVVAVSHNSWQESMKKMHKWQERGRAWQEPYSLPDL